MNNQSDNFASEATQDEILSSILQKLSSSPSSSPPASDGGGGGTGGIGGGGGDILSSLLSNPELIAKLPTILSSIKPIIDMLGLVGGASSSPPASVPVPVSAKPDSSESAPAALVKHGGKSDSRTALLCAMKPYLGRDRQNAIDYIVKLGRLGDILKTL